ncbi:NACHT, LRR and PYD domains-containing protein 1 homolog isoform X2 [Lissotriton helveticus]
MEHSLRDEEVLLSSSSLYGSIESYRKKVHQTEAIGWKSTRPGGDERDVHLRRRFHTSGKKLPNWMEKQMKLEFSNKEKRLERTEFAFEEKQSTVHSEALFTDETKELISQRMLITGEDGIGKSCFSAGLLKQWASGQRDLCYECIIYMTFSELNTMKDPVSVRNLLGSKCPELSPVLTELLNTDKVLIILDGLDEFNQELKVSSPSDAMCDIDTPLDISILISKVISKALLPDTHVLITSRMGSVRKIREHFTSTFILEAFTEDQVKQYCETFLPGDDRTKAVSECISNYKLCSLLSVPLLSSTLRHIYKKGPWPKSEGALATRSRMMYSALQVTLKVTLEETGHIDQECCTSLLNNASEVPRCIRNTINKLGVKSYNNLICGVREINKEDFAANCKHTECLFKHFAEFFFTADESGKKFEYRHASIRDMFAALYCVGEIRAEAELETVLNAWVFGDISESSRPPLLDNITPNHWKRLQSFIPFFLGLLPYADHGLLSETPSLSPGRREFLKSWFQAWIDKKPVKIKFFVFLHCVFELHDDDLAKHVSSHTQEAILFNVPLNSLDISALRYCLENSRHGLIDLRFCELSDACLKQLEEVIHTCKDVKLSCNKLTENSGDTFRHLLEHNECGIEKLCLCVNHFGVFGMKNLKELKRDRVNLKIVIRIADDEDVLLYVEDKVKCLLTRGWKKYNTELLVQIFDRVMADLNNDDEISHAKDTAKTKRIESLKANISVLRKQIKQALA